MYKIVFLLIALFPLLLKAQQATNVRVTQEGDNVVINYDLIGGQQSGQTYNIEVLASNDNSKSFTIIPKTISGDLKNIAPGVNKKIIWQVLNDLEELTGDGFVFKISVEECFAGDSGTFTDERDGEVYKWVKIGTQIWMAENLKATIYNDGKTIPNVTDEIGWKELKSGAYCWYGNNINNKVIYGALYNWHTVYTVKLCPLGWHVPNDEEWSTLETYLGVSNVAGSAMKSTSGWENNKNATNSSGFSGLPGGYRSNNGSFYSIGLIGYWWSSKEYSDTYARSKSLYYNTVDWCTNYKTYGLSVRCVKDN